jgi:hypothetical protein
MHISHAPYLGLKRWLIFKTQWSLRTRNALNHKDDGTSKLIHIVYYLASITVKHDFLKLSISILSAIITILITFVHSQPNNLHIFYENTAGRIYLTLSPTTMLTLKHFLVYLSSRGSYFLYHSNLNLLHYAYITRTHDFLFFLSASNSNESSFFGSWWYSWFIHNVYLPVIISGHENLCQ